MADFLSPEQRSKRMSRIGSKDTVPELALRRELHRLGLRYRLHKASLPGKPDLIFPRHRATVFVHGCFWHRHPGCKVASMPKSNAEFWQAKFERNVRRDTQVVKELVDMGWRVFIVWECELSSKARARLVAEGIAHQILRCPLEQVDVVEPSGD